MVATMRLPLTFGEDPRFIHFINNPLLYTINNSTSPYRFVQLNNLHKYYENKYGSVSSSTITAFAFGNDSFFMQLAKGK